MKRITVALAGLVAGAFLLLTGGAGDAAGLPTPSPTETAQAMDAAPAPAPANIIW